MARHATHSPEPDPDSLLFPIGHYVGVQFRSGEPTVTLVRRGGEIHKLTDPQAVAWMLAHGSAEAPARRGSIYADAISDLGAVIDGLIESGLLVEVNPGTDQAQEFARSHRLMPLMLGLGNSESADMFDIGFLGQPIMQVSHPIYDLWQWSTMDDTLWGACQNATSVALRGGATNADPGELLTGILGSLHGLLMVNAAYLDIHFRLNWPDVTESGSVQAPDDPEALIFPVGHYLGAHVSADTDDIDFHVIRTGWEIHKLESDEQFTTWALGYGLPESTGTVWTRATLEAAAKSAGITPTIAELTSQGLLIEVIPESAEAVTFAQNYRLRPLLIGLGNTAQEPTDYRIGASELAAAVSVSGFVYELWKWGHACDSLWHACHIFAAADPAKPAPQDILARALPAIGQLLANGALYLDNAASSP